jgi:tartrate dehydrogenase/decarboxylase/D-malate dehydrogenase
MRAIERVTAGPAPHTPGLGGKVTTWQVTEAEAVVAVVERDNA